MGLFSDDFDFGDFVSDIGTKVANIKGFDSLEALAINKTAANVARVTDKVNETKQTPPVLGPTAYTSQFLAEQGALGMSKGQLLLIGGMAVVALVFIIRR